MAEPRRYRVIVREESDHDVYVDARNAKEAIRLAFERRGAWGSSLRRRRAVSAERVEA